MQKNALNLTYAGLFVLALATFTSVSVSALSHILLIVPGIYFLIQYIKQNKLQGVPASLWLLVALVVIIGLSVISNASILEHPFKNFIKSKYFIMGILSVFAFNAFFRQEEFPEKKVKILLRTFLFATSVASASGIIGLYTGFNPLKFKAACHASRACGLFGMYMTYGYGISMFLILVTGLILYKDKVEKYVSAKWLYLCWIINFLGLFLSFTRGGWIAYLLSLPFFFFKKNRSLFIKVIAISGLIFAVTFFAVPKVKKMFLSRGQSNMERIAFYKAAYRAFTEKPLLGWGYKNFEPNVPAIKKKYNIEYSYLGGHAHNNFLEHLASTGGLGFIVVILFHLMWLREIYLRDDIVALITFPFIVNFIISGQFQYTFGDGENLFLILAVYALGQMKSLKKLPS